MKKIIALSGSNSSQSINQALATYAAKTAGGEVIQLTDYDVPMYGIDLEMSSGIPQDVSKLVELFQSADGVIISTPEHNGLMPAFFKNILDWLSRTGVKYLEGTNVVISSSSPGRGGAKGAAAAVEKIIGYAGANVVGRFSLPEFGQNFDKEAMALSNAELDEALKAELAKL